jgi:cyclopropane-fatty-acyl-phospholipid synthase
VANAERADGLGYDLRFRRMWELYLAYVEAGFRERRIGTVQVLLGKPEFASTIARKPLKNVTSIVA